MKWFKKILGLKDDTAKEIVEGIQEQNYRYFNFALEESNQFLDSIIKILLNIKVENIVDENDVIDEEEIRIVWVKNYWNSIDKLFGLADSMLRDELYYKSKNNYEKSGLDLKRISNFEFRLQYIKNEITEMNIYELKYIVDEIENKTGVVEKFEKIYK